MLLGFICLSILLVACVMFYVLRPLFAESTPVRLLVLTCALGAIVASLYFLEGTPAALNPRMLKPAATLDDAIAQLEQRVSSHPKDSAGWSLLSEAYLSQRKYGQALLATVESVKAEPANADILTQAAQERGLATPNHQLDATAIQWLQQALVVDPTHQDARFLLGLALRQQGHPEVAAATWTPLLAKLDRNAGIDLLAQINLARASAGLSPLSESSLKALGPHDVQIQVRIPDSVLKILPDGTQLFVVAQNASGQGMPLAVRKIETLKSSITVWLSDSDGPMPTAKLSQTSEVTVSARLSPTGMAMLSPGGRQSEKVRVTLPHAQTINLSFP